MIISRTLRVYERSPAFSSALNSVERKNIRDSCCVMVLLPTRFWLLPKTLVNTAASSRTGLIPGCE